jgi:hypothetical protein
VYLAYLAEEDRGWVALKSCGHQNSDPSQSKEEENDPRPRNPEALRHLRMINLFVRSTEVPNFNITSFRCMKSRRRNVSPVHPIFHLSLRTPGSSY